MKKGQKVIPHPSYDPKKIADFDVALVKLKEPIKFEAANLAIGPICLPTKEDLNRLAGTRCIASGWGNVDHKDRK